MQLIYRELTASDALAYRKIRLQCLKNFPDNFGSTFEEEVEIPELLFEKMLKNKSDSAFMLGAFDAENIIGICGFVRESQKKRRHRGEITQMYVNPTYKGLNVGFNLLRKTVEQAFNNLGIEQIVLGVVSNNPSANKLYEKLGFVEYGFLENYFKVGNNYLHQRFMVLTKTT